MSTMTSTAPEETPRADGSGEMFDRIAQRYDRLNRIISFGMDRGWRRKLVAEVLSVSPRRVLDVATGTADVAIDIARAHDEVALTGLDPSEGMLEVGRGKVADEDLSERVALITGDAQEMPFEDDHFDASCISFGIRNVPDRALGLREMRRVTRSGGKVIVLELSEPRGGILAPFARFHVHHVVPRLGALLSGKDAYTYLRQSIADFPPPETFAQMMRDAGLEEVAVHRMSFGAAHLYVGSVP